MPTSFTGNARQRVGRRSLCPVPAAAPRPVEVRGNKPGKSFENLLRI